MAILISIFYVDIIQWFTIRFQVIWQSLWILKILSFSDQWWCVNMCDQTINFMDNWIAKARRTDDHACGEIINNIGTVCKTSTETSTRTTPFATTVSSTSSSPTIVGLLPSSSGSTSSSSNTETDICDSVKPYQPCDVADFPTHVDQGRTRHFQVDWYKWFPWLQYTCSVHLKVVVCFTCAKASSKSLLLKQEDTFISRGLFTRKMLLTPFPDMNNLHATIML